MAHEIRLETNISQIINKDIKVTVRTGANGKLKKLGALLISKGNIEWLPANNHVNKFRMSWADLAGHIEENGKKVKV